MRPKHKRLTFMVVGLGLLGVASALALAAMESGIVFFHTPSEVAAQGFAGDRRIRLGGLVEEGSLAQSAGATVAFRITDTVHAVPVRYTGLLPDLFDEGQGVVAEGRLEGGVFMADEVLAKHDENYMPPEAADALKQAGYWQHAGPRAGEAAEVEQ